MDTSNPKIFPPGSPLAKFNRRKWIILIIVLFTLLCIAFWITNTGCWPASVLIKWEASIFDGKYYFKSVAVAIWAGMVIVMALLWKVFSFFHGNK
jgi:hypothetical protein